MRDEQFAVIHRVSPGPRLDAFRAAWETKTVVESASPEWRYKLDIESGGRSQRWLYDPSGLVRMLTINRTPTYRLADPGGFNAVLHLPNSTPQQSRPGEPA